MSRKVLKITNDQILFSLLFCFSISIFIFYSFDIINLNIQLTDIFFILIFVFSVLNSLYTNKITIDKNNLNLIYIILILILIFFISTLLARNAFNSFKGLIKWSFGLSSIFIFPNIIKSVDKWKKLYYAFLWTGNILLLISLLEIVFISRSISQHGFRFIGFHPNQAGQICVFLFCLNVSLFLFNNNLKHKIIYLFFMVINLITLTLTYSKACWVVGIVSFVFILIIYLRKKVNLLVKFFIILFFIILIIVLGNFLEIIFSKYLSSRIYSLEMAVSNPLNYKSMLIRYNLWKIAYELGIENLFGVGLYNLEYYLPNYNHAHNIFFELLGSVCFLGLFTFMLLIIFLFFKLIKITFYNKKYSIYKIGLFFSIISYFFANNFSDSFGPRTHWLFWVGTVLLISLNKYC